MDASKASVERNENINYLRAVEMGYESVDRGEANFLYVMNPTRMLQVRDCTKDNVKMPQKSTDFFPKIISGLTALPIGLDERL